MATSRVLIYLLRRDLRLADNPVFHDISRTFPQSKHPHTHVLPLYVFSAQQIEVSGFLSSSDSRSPYPEARSQHGGFWRCGPHRATFLAESIWDLKTALEEAGSGLTIRVGMVGDVVKDLLDGFKKSGSAEVSGLWMTSEEGVEEKREEQEARRAVEAEGKEFRLWTDEKYFVDEYVSSSPACTLLTAAFLGTNLISFAVVTYHIQVPVTYQMSSPATANPWSPFARRLVVSCPPQTSFLHSHLPCLLKHLHLPFRRLWRESSRPCTSQLPPRALFRASRCLCHREPSRPIHSVVAPRLATPD